MFGKDYAAASSLSRSYGASRHGSGALAAFASSNSYGASSSRTRPGYTAPTSSAGGGSGSTSVANRYLRNVRKDSDVSAPRTKAESSASSPEFKVMTNRGTWTEDSGASEGRTWSISATTSQKVERLPSKSRVQDHDSQTTDDIFLPSTKPPAKTPESPKRLNIGGRYARQVSESGEHVPARSSWRESVYGIEYKEKKASIDASGAPAEPKLTEAEQRRREREKKMEADRLRQQILEEEREERRLRQMLRKATWEKDEKRIREVDEEIQRLKQKKARREAEEKAAATQKSQFTRQSSFRTADMAEEVQDPIKKVADWQRQNAQSFDQPTESTPITKKQLQREETLKPSGQTTPVNNVYTLSPYTDFDEFMRVQLQSKSPKQAKSPRAKARYEWAYARYLDVDLPEEEEEEEEEVKEGSMTIVYKTKRAKELFDVMPAELQNLVVRAQSRPLRFSAVMDICIREKTVKELNKEEEHDFQGYKTAADLLENLGTDLIKLQASRIWWCRLLLRLPVELCGLLELLSPSPRSGPVFLTLRSLVDRVANLGPPIASILASSTVDILLDLFSSAQLADKTKEQTAAPREDSSGDTINDSAQAASGAGSVVNELSTPGCLLTAGAKLVLGTPSTPPMHESGHASPSPAAAVVETSVMHHSTAPQTADDWQAHSRPFSDICEPSDIGRALCLLFVILNQSECKQAFLDLLRESSQPTPNSGGSSNPSRGSRLLSVFANILESCTESKAHITTQSLLIDCIDALLDHKLGVPPVLSSSASADEIQNWECANHLPNTQFLDSLTGLLLVYLDHPDRDLSSLPNVLQILQRLCSHDHGFTLLQKHLSSPKHSLVFANLIGRVNDSFSAENPYYRATLAHLLMLFSTLLDDTVFAEEAAAAVASLSDNKGARPSSPLRDHISVGLADDVALSPTGSSSSKLLRRYHLCGAQLRQLLHRTGQEPNPVRDLSSLLELLAADDPSLKPLHTGMKGLVQILTESESKGSDEELLSGFAETQVISLPEPLPLADLLSQRPVFHLLFGDQQSCDLSSLWHSRSSACQKVQDTPVLATANDFAKDLKSVNLVDISSEFCPGLDLREELTIRFGRRHADDPGTTMRHQKRRKGQPSIIQTGRNTKYVAPMRGRGFNIRGAGGGGSGPSLLGSGVCGGGGGGGGTPSLLGSGHRPDIFRSRPQNTSRPPSLHVDDFNKLEKDDNASERNYGREESARFRLFRDGRPGRGRGGSGGGGGAGSLLSGAPLSGMGNLNPYRQPPRVLSTLPFVGAALAPTVSAAGPGGGILPAAAMATFLNWGGKPMNISGIPTTAASYRSRHTGLLPPRNN